MIELPKDEQSLVTNEDTGKQYSLHAVHAWLGARTAPRKKHRHEVHSSRPATERMQAILRYERARNSCFRNNTHTHANVRSRPRMNDRKQRNKRAKFRRIVREKPTNASLTRGC
eukprot:TRINITY_DN58425_c0_g1_i1.p1 TRINITY_DN58425_c0_g1~~TRINITY_DN58425_c0_g1_i1.p1  ORF type:complete len:134 (+),score=3.54 TRINITY_DN58425_c0_g1_i1:63-404(+)